MNNNSFRVIAVRVYEKCADHIRKALKTNETYFLCNDYENHYDKAGKWIGIRRAQKNNGQLPINFFAGSEEYNSNPTINITAVVGKNGEGKSSLIELILRIINNFSVRSGFLEDQE